MAQLVIKEVQVPEWAQQLWNLPQKINVVVNNIGKIAKETNGRCFVKADSYGIAVWCRSGSSSVLMASVDIFEIIRKTGAELKKDDNTYIVDGEIIESYLLDMMKKKMEEEKQRQIREEIARKIAKALGISRFEFTIEIVDNDYTRSLERTAAKVINELREQIGYLRDQNKKLRERLEMLKEFIEDRNLAKDFIEFVMEKRTKEEKEKIAEEYGIKLPEEEDEEDW